jgi:hypothetical protein
MFRRILNLWRRLLHGESEAPREEKANSKEEDRRVWVRHPSTAQAVVQGVGNCIVTRLSARVRNVSRGGINLLLDRPLQPGEMISIELPGSTPQKTSTVLACVVHVREQGPGEWSTGCTFSESLSDPDLETFGARRQKPARSDDHRSWVRFPCNVEASCQRVDDSEDVRWAARVMNISAAGIGLMLDRPVENGTLLNLDLRSPTTHSTRTILACVVHVTSRPGEWNVGCNFIRELSDADLEALL